MTLVKVVGYSDEIKHVFWSRCLVNLQLLQIWKPFMDVI